MEVISVEEPPLEGPTGRAFRPLAVVAGEGPTGEKEFQPNFAG